jgi:hypothetical protein
MDARTTAARWLAADTLPRWTRPLLRALGVDFDPPRPPSGARVTVATVLALAGSLLGDALLVRLGTSIYPTTKSYVHFAFFDYARLTTVGVVAAGVGWPIVARIASSPDRLFARLAVIVSAVLLAPDAYIWHAGSPAEAVFVLVWMHLAIALVTYFALTLLAPVSRGRHAR